MLIINKCKLDKRKNNFFHNAALKWNEICAYIINPYTIILHQDSITNINWSGDRQICSINYDLSLSVSVLKNKLKEILLHIQCHGAEHEWLSLNSELKTFPTICPRNTLVNNL